MAADQHNAAAHGPAPRRSTPMLARLGQSAPYAIVVYLIVLGALRLSFSPFLEIDEAGLIGKTGLQLLYPEFHPPLFHWMTRTALELLDWDWPTALTYIRYGALGLFHLAIWDITRRMAGPRVALLAVAASALMPQIVWMSATTYTHPILALAMAAATLNALIRAFEDPTPTAYALFGVVAGLGALSDFSFLIFFIPLMAATALEPELRYAFRKPTALIAVGAFVAIAGPTYVTALLNLGDSTDRLAALFAPSSLFSFLDAPWIGLDGGLSLLGAILVSIGPVALVWALARTYDSGFGETLPPAHPFAPVMERVMLYGLAATFVILAATDARSAPEAMLMPLFAIFPAFIAVAWPLRWSATAVVIAASALYLVTLAAFTVIVSFFDHRYAIPYDRVAAQLSRHVDGVVTPIVATRGDDAENVVLALGWPGAATPSATPLGDQAVLLWRGRTPAPRSIAPEGFAPARGIVTVVAPLTNESGVERVFRFQLFERLPPGAQLITGPADNAVTPDLPIEIEPRAAGELDLLQAGNLPPT